jgi:hypothetical protein
MGGPDRSAEQEAVYVNLMDAGDRFDHARRRRDRPTKLRRLAQSWESYDYGKSRLEDVIRQARQAGLDWEAIGEAIGMEESEAVEQFGHVDRW